MNRAPLGFEMFCLLNQLVCLCNYAIKGLDEDHKVSLNLFSHINDKVIFFLK